MKQDRLHDFFSSASMFVFIIPLITFAVVLYKGSGLPARLSALRQVRNVRQNTTIQPSVTPKKELPRLFACNSVTRDASSSAFRNGNNIAVTLIKKSNVSRYLVKEDCLYQWEPDTGQKGIKICGIGRYIGLADMAVSMGLLNAQSIGQTVEAAKQAGVMGIVPADIEQLLNSCTTISNMPPGIFDLPGNIRFLEQKQEQDGLGKQ